MARTIEFPKYTGLRCLMMPYRQGDPDSVPGEFAAYHGIITSVFVRRDDVGYLTIDESPVRAGDPHRGARAKHGRALHTEAGLVGGVAGWGPGPSWGGHYRVTLDRDVRVLLANNIDDSCAVWNAEHPDTTDDGDIGHLAADYPYSNATLMRAGDVHEIGIFTPHESLPVARDADRQFLRIVSSGVHVGASGPACAPRPRAHRMDGFKSGVAAAAGVADSGTSSSGS